MIQRSGILFGLTACCAWGAEPSAEDGSPQVILHCDFDTDAWLQQWGLSKPPERTQLVQADSERKFEPLRGRALCVHVEQGGHYGISLEFPFKKRLGYEPEEVYFRYYLRFADDWTPRRGGKLPGFGGTYGRAGWGGRPVDGTDGFREMQGRALDLDIPVLQREPSAKDGAGNANRAPKFGPGGEFYAAALRGRSDTVYPRRWRRQVMLA